MIKAAGRIKELDALRGIAVLGVVLYHYTTRFGELFGRHPGFSLDFPYGTFGVQLFFIISGFVILMTIEKTQSAGQFLLHRFARLYPSYWVAVVVTFTLVKLFALPGLEVGRLSALVNLTMLQSFFNFPHVDGVYWSLTVELIFYAVMAILIIFNKIERLERLSIFWLAAVLAFHLFFKTSLDPVSLFLRYAHLFLAGMMFYWLKTHGLTTARNLIVIACLGTQLILAPVGEGIVVTLFFAAFYLLVFGKLDFINNRGLLFLGAISYPLYLVHENIGYLIIRQLYAWQASYVLVIFLPCPS